MPPLVASAIEVSTTPMPVSYSLKTFALLGGAGNIGFSRIANEETSGLGEVFKGKKGMETLSSLRSMTRGSS